MKNARQSDNKRIGCKDVLQPSINTFYIGRIGNQVVIDQSVNKQMDNTIGHHQDSFSIGLIRRLVVILIDECFVINHREDHKDQVRNEEEVVDAQPEIGCFLSKPVLIQVEDGTEHEQASKN